MRVSCCIANCVVYEEFYLLGYNAMQSVKSRVLLAICFALVSSLPYSSILNLKALCSAEFQRTTQHYIPEDRTFCKHHCENRRSYICRVPLCMNLARHTRFVPCVFASLESLIVICIAVIQSNFQFIWQILFLYICLVSLILKF
jgi:hypothetical protein